MSIKLILLKSGENIVSGVKELVSGEKTVAYMLNNPHIIFIKKPISLTEGNESVQDLREVQAVLTEWIPLSKSNDIVIPTDWVVTIVDPIDSVEELYSEKING